jgi:Fic family protein
MANGRHARLMTDIFIYSHRYPLPAWPQVQVIQPGNDVRARYIDAMKKADTEDYRDLMKFIQDQMPDK